MSLPNQKALSEAYPNDVWSQAAVIDTYVEGMLAKLVPVGGRIACEPFLFERKTGGMHVTESLEGRAAHVDIDVDLNDDQNEISGHAVPDSPLDPAVLAGGNINLKLSGEVVRDKLRACAQLLEHLAYTEVS